MTQAVAFSPYSSIEQAVPAHFANSDFSLECWLKLQGKGFLFQHSPEPCLSFSVSITEEGKLLIHYQNSEFDINLMSEQGGVNLGRWTHILIIKKQQSLQLFSNGHQIEMREVGKTTNLPNLDIFNQQLSGKNHKIISGLLLGDNSIPNTLNGTLKELTIWDIAINKSLRERYAQPCYTGIMTREITPPIFSSDSVLSAIPVTKLKHFISLTFDNQSNYLLQKAEQYQNNSSEWPSQIAPLESISIKYEEASYSHFVTRQAMYTAMLNPEIKLCITLTKSEIASESLVRVTASNKLNKSIQVEENTDTHLKAHVVICNASEHLDNEHNEANEKNLARKQEANNQANANGDSLLVTQASPANIHVTFDQNTQIACICAEGKIGQITSELALNNVMFAHGIDANASLTASIFNHHTGPWTRTQGMSAEHLVAAEIALPDGSIETTSAFKSPQQYWAIKTLGRPQSGTVTQYYFKTFPLPAQLIKFALEWNPNRFCTTSPGGIPTLDIITAWEQLIASPHINQLAGSYLKINAIHNSVGARFDYRTCTHNCQMHGYWQGSPIELEDFIHNKWTAVGAKPDNIDIQGISGLGHGYQAEKNHLWFRESVHNVQLEAIQHSKFSMPPDQFEPFSHQSITRFSSREGLNQQGLEALMLALATDLTQEKARQQGVFNYVTLEAIAGNRFKTKPTQKVNELTPYQHSLYALRFQTYSPLRKEKNTEETSSIVQAQQWIDKCQHISLPNTSKLFQTRTHPKHSHNSNENIPTT